MNRWSMKMDPDLQGETIQNRRPCMRSRAWLFVRLVRYTGVIHRRIQIHRSMNLGFSSVIYRSSHHSARNKFETVRFTAVWRYTGARLVTPPTSTGFFNCSMTPLLRLVRPDIALEACYWLLFTTCWLRGQWIDSTSTFVHQRFS